MPKLSVPSVVFATFCNDDLFQEYALFVPQDAHEKAEQTKTNQPTPKKTKQNTNAGLFIHNVYWVSNLGKLWEFPRIRVLSSWALNSGISLYIIFLVVMIKWLRYSKNSKHPLAWSQVQWHRRWLASWFGRKICLKLNDTFYGHQWAEENCFTCVMRFHVPRRSIESMLPSMIVVVRVYLW